MEKSNSSIVVEPQNLVSSSQSEHKMKGALLLDLGLDILNGVRWLNLQGDGLACEGLDKDLHSSSQSEHKMKSALLLDVVVRKGPSILKLLSSKDQPLLVWGNSLLVLDLGLDILNGVRWLNLQSDGLASEG